MEYRNKTILGLVIIALITLGFIAFIAIDNYNTQKDITQLQQELEQGQGYTYKYKYNN